MIKKISTRQSTVITERNEMKYLRYLIQDVVGTYLSFFLIRVETIFICGMLRGITVCLSPLYPNSLYHFVQIFVAGYHCLVPPPETIT